jgi:ferredoxin
LLAAKEEKMKASVDPDTCIGCELCPTISPEVFRMEEDGLAHTIVSVVPSDAEETAREAAESCPVQAITIEE